MVPLIVSPTLQQAEYQRRGLELLQLARGEPLLQRRRRYLVAAERFLGMATGGHAAVLKELRAHPY
jgi:hypothetical protein